MLTPFFLQWPFQLLINVHFQKGPSNATRLLMSPVDSSSSPGQTIRLVAASSQSQAEDHTPIGSSNQTIRIVTSGGTANQAKVAKNSTRTITLAEARQMGLITSAKINTIIPTTILPKPNNVGFTF